MPLHDFSCEGCGDTFERFSKMDAIPDFLACPCGGRAKRMPAKTNVYLFPEGWTENLGDEPVYIKSKKNLREECAKRGLQSKMLD